MAALEPVCAACAKRENACALGIDVGGTSIKAGLLTCTGEVLATAKVPTGRIVGQEAFKKIAQGLSGLVERAGRVAEDVVAVGLDVPGPVDDRGNVGMLANIELDPDGLCMALRDAFPEATLAFVNDANAAALGELWRGSAKGVDSFVMVTLGTGVGGGVVVGGRLVPGAFGAGGEIGHMTVVKEGEGRTCGCGRHGCLEQYASAKGLVWLYRDECARRSCAPVALAHETDALAVFDALRAGDACADAAVSRMCEHLGYALAQVSTIIDPAVYLVGGGVAGAFDLYAERLSASFRAHCLAPSSATRILPCSLGNDAGMYGVAYEALRQAGLA
ncbi:ROK family protein [Olsenella urininfantis]|uniref:ROK family protein n=1 Tax=Olsenella urininfantis TaxID=1871033 RepID=UPI000987B4B4|nr:ROK family protein [Olsenella urininfantis]